MKTHGYRRLHVLLRREGWRVNHKRVYRLYREEGRSIRTQYRKKQVSLPPVTPPPTKRPGERWSIDSMGDRLVNGRRFRVVTIGDHVSRVSPAIEVGCSLTAEQVVAVLDRLKPTVGRPERLAVDNGPEFISKALDAWADCTGVTVECSGPGKPTDHADVESCNGHCRAECLDPHECERLDEARRGIEAWRVADNTEGPHRALNQQTPAAVAAAWASSAEAAD